MLSRRAVLSFAVLTFSATMAPFEADAARGSHGQIYLIRGLANIFSTGLNVLQTELAKQGIKAETRSLSTPQSLAQSIADLYRSSRTERPVILVGHSFGADEAINTAAQLQKLKIPVALVVTFDPTIHGPLTGNVHRAINFYSGGKAIWGKVEPARDFKGRLLNVDTAKGKNAIPGIDHFNIEKNEKLHQWAIREIKAALRHG